jgi:hypothetical protein
LKAKNEGLSDEGYIRIEVRSIQENQRNLNQQNNMNQKVTRNL